MRALSSLLIVLPALLGFGSCAPHVYVAPLDGVTVPEARGLEIPYAVERIQRAGLRAATLGYACDESRTRQRYYVRSQRPLEGTTVARDTVVVLRLDYMHSQGVRVAPLPLRRGLHLCR